MADPVISNTTTTGPPWLTPDWQSYVQRTQNLTNGPLPTYGGPTVAPWNPQQQTAADMWTQFATNGTPTGNAANSAIQTQSNGVANPYATQTNAYQGNNPYLQQMVSGVNQNMSDAYARGTAAQTDAAAARGGAYGGSGYNELTAANNKAFGQALGNVDAGLYSQNYYNSGQLADNQLNRET